MEDLTAMSDVEPSSPARHSRPHAASSSAAAEKENQAEGATVVKGESPARGSGKALGKRKAVLSPKNARPAAARDDDSDDADLHEVGRPAARAASNKEPTCEDCDGEVAFVGRTGDLALIDYPHSRENCFVKAFVPGKEHERCPNCYCFICDAIATSCPEWASHCKATHTSDEDCAKREQWKIDRLGTSSSAATGAAASSSSLDTSLLDDDVDAKDAKAKGAAIAAGPPPKVDRWSCDEILKAIEQVYPIEEPEPAGLVPTMKLRPYQKQSLAFMLKLERSTSLSTRGYNSTTDLHPRGGWLCDEMGMGLVTRDSCRPEPSALCAQCTAHSTAPPAPQARRPCARRSSSRIRRRASP